MAYGGTAAPSAPKPTVVRQFAQPRSGAAPKSLAWKPFKLPPVPAGSYNPTLDAELSASQRGVQDTENEVATDEARDTTDYGTGVEGINREAQQGLESIATQRQQEQQNYQQALQRLGESYKRLGVTQGEQQNQAGVLEGGAVLQAAAKRASNENKERQPLAQSDERTLAALGTKQQELEQNKALKLAQLALTDAPPEEGNPVGGRDFQDLVTKLTKAQREGAYFGLDTAAQKDYQAAQAGYVPPAAPKGQRTTQSGQTYHTISHGNEWWDVTPSGQVIKRRPK